MLNELRAALAAAFALAAQGSPAAALPGATPVAAPMQPPGANEPPAGGDAALERAWLFRRDSLGPRHPETAAALAALARLRGLPSHTRGEPARIGAAADLFRSAIAAFGTSYLEPGEVGSVGTRMDLAAMFQENGLFSEAMTAALEAQADYATHFFGRAPMCETMVDRTFALRNSLNAAGRRAEADALIAGLRERVGCCRAEGPETDCYGEIMGAQIESFPLTAFPRRRRGRR